MKRFKTNVGNTERLISIAAGTALVAYRLKFGKRRKLLFDPVFAEGISLLARGLIGVDPFYRALDVSTVSPKPYSKLEKTSWLGTVTYRVRRSITIDKPREELFKRWRFIGMLPPAMNEIDEVPYECVSWRSAQAERPERAGTIYFREAPGGRGTELTVELEYVVSGGAIGKFLKTIQGREPEQKLREALRRFKQIVETGEVSTSDMRVAGSF